MAIELIPYPISAIFIVVFAFAWMAILWNLRKKGRIYSLLFKLSLLIVALLFLAILFSIILAL